MKSALDVHRELLAAGVVHEMVRLRTPVLSGDDLPRALGVPEERCVVVRCYRTVSTDGGVQLVAVLVRAGATPDPVSLLDAVAATSLRVATAGEINATTDYAAGLVSPLCLPADVRLLADAALGLRSSSGSGDDKADDVVYVPTGESGVALGIHLRDLLVASGARVTSLTAQPLADADRRGWDGASDTPNEPVAPVVALTTRGPRRTG